MHGTTSRDKSYVIAELTCNQQLTGAPHRTPNGAAVHYGLQMSVETERRLYRFGVFEADPGTGELRKQGKRIRLAAQPFEILIMLLERPGEVVTRDDIRQRLWPEGTFVDFDHGLNAAVAKLRDALGDSAASPRFIETLARRGYRFIAPVSAPAETQSSTAPTLPPTDEVPVAVLTDPADVPQHARSTARILFALVQVLFLAFYVAALANFREIGDLMEVATGKYWTVSLVLVSAAVGIPVRLYLLSAVSFRAPKLRTSFLALFPGLLVLDLLWAASPFLMVHHIGLGLALCATAALAYLPFSQRTLILMGAAD